MTNRNENGLTPKVPIRRTLTIGATIGLPMLVAFNFALALYFGSPAIDQLGIWRWLLAIVVVAIYMFAFGMAVIGAAVVFYQGITTIINLLRQEDQDTSILGWTESMNQRIRTASINLLPWIAFLLGWAGLLFVIERLHLLVGASD